MVLIKFISSRGLTHIIGVSCDYTFERVFRESFKYEICGIEEKE